MNSKYPGLSHEQLNALYDGRRYIPPDPSPLEKLNKLTIFGNLLPGDAFELQGGTLIKCISSNTSNSPVIDAVCVFSSRYWDAGVRYQIQLDTEVYQVRLRRE